jgi:Flp pilus assembly protein TadG
MSSRFLNFLSNRALARRAKNFGRRKDGSTIVEFAFLLPPFLLLLFAIIQTAVVFYASQVLETATADAARLIMTGQAQKQGLTEAEFKTQLCSRLDALFNCNTGVKIDVRKYAWASGTDPIAQFASANLEQPLDEDGNLDTDDFGYTPGVQGDIVVVKVVYEWPMLMGVYSFDLATLPSGKRLLMSTAAFRNEPYNVNNP